jgi:DNA-binding transcriptional ArsR family regulator
MKIIKLNTKEELNIYMNPMRQKLLRQLSIHKSPMTPKMLADQLSISPSGIQHHIRKLLSLGLIELDHQELINGITASFYKPAMVTVQIGLEKEDGTEGQREVIVQDSLANVYEGFRTTMIKRKKQMDQQDINSLREWGDVLTGVIHLKEKESKELMHLISEYIEEHSVASADTLPWEYAVIIYNAEEC